MSAGVAAEVGKYPALARARAERRARSLAQALLLLPLLALFVGFFILPLLVMGVISLLTGNPVNDENVRFTLANYQKLFSDRFYLEVLVVTLKLGLIATLIAILIGYPLAYQLARARSPRVRTLLLVAVLSPLLTGIVVRTYAWMTLLADHGVINSFLASQGLIEKPLPLMYNQFGVVVALVHIFTPFMVLTLTGVIGKIDPRLEEAARSLGASRPRAFLEVTLPLSMPGILAGSLLVFSLTISSYVTPILMGGFSILTLPILIYQQINGVFNFAFGAALAFLLLAVSLVLVVLYFRIVKRVAGGAFA